MNTTNRVSEGGLKRVQSIHHIDRRVRTLRNQIVALFISSVEHVRRDVLVIPVAGITRGEDIRFRRRRGCTSGLHKELRENRDELRARTNKTKQNVRRYSLFLFEIKKCDAWMRWVNRNVCGDNCAPRRTRPRPRPTPPFAISAARRDRSPSR